LPGRGAMVGAVVGTGPPGVSADATSAIPRLAPSTSSPEPIATAVFVEIATLLATSLRRFGVVPNSVKLLPGNELGRTCQATGNMSFHEVLDKVGVWLAPR
jgi:hypothetical protein